jgi:hypothetical protein
MTTRKKRTGQFTPDQLARLRRHYASTTQTHEVDTILKHCDDLALLQLALADIKYISFRAFEICRKKGLKINH